MDFTFVLGRVVHVTLGVFWAGTMVFNAVFLFPALRDAGPDGAKVGVGLMKRNFMVTVPVVAILTLLSGLYLLWKASAGFAPAYMGSAPGMAYSIGMLASLVAFGFGVGVVRPSMLKAMELSQGIGTAAAADRDRIIGEAQALRLRAGNAGQVVAWLLGAATVTMAVARYL